MANKRFFGAIDLGEEQFVALAAQPLGASSYEIAGCGVAKAQGFERGMITDIDKASTALSNAVRQAEIMANGKIDLGVVTSISGTHIEGENKKGHVKIQGGAVTEADVELALATLQAFPITQGFEVLHVLEQEYIIDSHGGIRRPIGMTGSLLEAEAYVVTARSSVLANLKACLNKAGLDQKRVISSALAAGVEVTTEDECELGVVALDWGSGTCDYVVLKDGVPIKINTLNCGGADIDRDIAKIFRISLSDSERIKRNIGSAVQVQINEDAGIAVKDADGKNNKKIEPHILSMTIQPRIDEMLEHIKHDLGSMLDKERMPAGIVLSGGMARLAGIVQIANDELGVPVRIGTPNYSGSHAEEVADSQFSVCHGLLHMWLKEKPQLSRAVGDGFLNWLNNLFSGA